MHKRLTTRLLASGTLLLTACGGQSAVDYNNKLVTITNPGYQAYIDYNTYSNNSNDINMLDNLDEARKETIKKIDEIINQLEETGPYKKDDSLQQAFIADFEIIKNILSDQEVALIQVRRESSEINNEDRTDEIESNFKQQQQDVVDEIKQIVEETDGKMQKAQKDFADKYGFETD